MLKYIGKRILQMIPTVFGVILITFVLFNIVGGSPAQQVLGPHAQAETLEQFDEQRGFNKPLFPLIGSRKVTTRAYTDSDFERSVGNWQGMDGVMWINGAITLAANGEYKLPLKFDLRTDCKYRLEMNATGITVSEDCKTLKTGEASGEIRSIKLRRVMNNPFDSQFTFYLNRLAHLDFGVSHSTNQRVSKLLLDGIGPSLMLSIPIFFIGLITAVMLSLFCAFWRDTWIDRFFVVFSVALMSVNYLVWIVGGQYLLGFKLGWFPVWDLKTRVISRCRC
jgi:ABC-type dipeptide/oligopeptide/nickel transport system permease component